MKKVETIIGMTISKEYDMEIFKKFIKDFNSKYQDTFRITEYTKTQDILIFKVLDDSSCKTLLGKLLDNENPSEFITEFCVKNNYNVLFKEIVDVMVSADYKLIEEINKLIITNIEL